MTGWAWVGPALPDATPADVLDGVPPGRAIGAAELAGLAAAVGGTPALLAARLDGCALYVPLTAAGVAPVAWAARPRKRT